MTTPCMVSWINIVEVNLRLNTHLISEPNQIAYVRSGLRLFVMVSKRVWFEFEVQFTTKRIFSWLIDSSSIISSLSRAKYNLTYMYISLCWLTINYAIARNIKNLWTIHYILYWSTSYQVLWRARFVKLWYYKVPKLLQTNQWMVFCPISTSHWFNKKKVKQFIGGIGAAKELSFWHWCKPNTEHSNKSICSLSLRGFRSGAN